MVLEQKMHFFLTQIVITVLLYNNITLMIDMMIWVASGWI